MADSKEFRTKFYATNLLFLALVVGILVLLNLTSNRASRFKVDFSEDGIYSLSPATEQILGKLKDQIKVTYFASDNLDDLLGTIRRDTIDLFEELHRISDGRFEYRVVDPEEEIETEAAQKVAKYMELRKKGKTEDLEEPEVFDPMSFMQGRQPPSAEELRKQREELADQLAARTKRDKEDVYRELLESEWKEKLAQDLEQQGVQAQVGQDRKADSVRQVKIYSTIKIEYLNEPAEIIPSHQSIEGLEYELANRIVKLTTKIKPTVAFFDARKPEGPPPNPFSPQPSPQSEYAAVIEYLGRLFNVEQISLKEGDSIDDLLRRLKKDKERREREERGEEPPKEDDEDAGAAPIVAGDFKLLECLIVAQPDRLEERQVYEINRAVSQGVKTIVLISPYSLGVNAERADPLAIPIEQLDTGLDPMLRAWGVQLGNELLASNECGITSITYRHPQLGLPVSQAIPLRVILATTSDAINQESGFTNRISSLVFPATAGFRLDDEAIKKAKLEANTLAKTSEESWKVAVSPMDRMQGPFGNQQTPGMTVRQYQDDLVTPKDPTSHDFMDAPVALAVELSGKFPFIYEGESVPAWKKPAPKSDEGEMPGAGDLPFGHPPLGDRDALPDLDDPTAANEEAAASDSEAGAADEPASADSAAAPATPEGASSPAPAPTSPSTAPGDSASSTAGASSTPVEVSTEASAAAAEPAEKAHVEPADGRVLLLSSVDMLKDGFLQYNRQFPPYREGVNLLQNAVELYGLPDGELLVEVRRKTQAVRTFEDDSGAAADWIQAFNLAGLPLLVAVLGLLRYFARRRASVRYERDYLRSHQSEA